MTSQDKDINIKQKNAENSTPSKIGKIVVDRDMCIGAGPCVALAPGTFELDNEGKAVVINPKGDTDKIL